MSEKTATEQALENETFRVRVTDAAKILGIEYLALAQHLVEKLGADTPDLLREVTFQDLTELEGTKPAKVRAALKELKGERPVIVAVVGEDDGAKEAGSPKAISPKKAASMTISQLVAAYDPREADNPVGARLKTIVGSKRCVVFTADGAVDTGATTKLVDELRDGFPERDAYVEEGKSPRSTFRIGDRPDNLADENPLYANRPLRPDGTCDVTSRSWAKAGSSVRVLLRIATHVTQEFPMRSSQDAHDALDLAMLGDAEQRIRVRCPKASIEYDRLQKLGQLPTLKVQLGGVSATGGSDPFFRGQQSGHIRT
ncbi:hypothetical protein HYV74_00140 [Candidatus Uhrbacteria bacterium]|nr:hypothetical protein [Candidatus Uhrbacteria bacterium]